MALNNMPNMPRTPYPGGAPANVACALAQLGDSVLFLSAIGTDDLGQQFRDLLTGACSGVGMHAHVLDHLCTNPTQSVGWMFQQYKMYHNPLGMCCCLYHTHPLVRNTHPSRWPRDVLVVRSLDGDREFSGFGKAETTAYADCFVDASKLPIDKIEVCLCAHAHVHKSFAGPTTPHTQAAQVLITGTLGLAYPATAEAMRTAVAAAKKGTGLVIVDVNWRPVFWSDTKVVVCGCPRGKVHAYQSIHATNAHHQHRQQLALFKNTFKQQTLSK